jgi:hypothetical protein
LTPFLFLGRRHYASLLPPGGVASARVEELEPVRLAFDLLCQDLSLTSTRPSSLGIVAQPQSAFSSSADNADYVRVALVIVNEVIELSKGRLGTLPAPCVVG